MKETEEYSI